jgi:hypothetical protein
MIKEPGQPSALINLHASQHRRLKGAPGRGTLEKEKPPILGLIQLVRNTRRRGKGLPGALIATLIA